MLILLVLHGQNPKTEARDPKEGRNPKSDNRKTQQALPGPRLVRASGFGFPSDFGLRASDFRAACPDRVHTSPDPSAAALDFFMVGGPELVTLLPK